MCNYHPCPVKRNCRRAIELIPKRKRLTDPVAERRIIRAGQHTISG